MAKYNPFAEKAGLQKVAEQKPVNSLLAISAFLSKSGFDLQLLGSERYVLEKLTALNQSEIEQLKEIIRAWGENPEEILSRDALIRGNITETQEQTNNHQLSILAEQLKQLVKAEVSE